jgi:hypothetical protein
MLTDELKFSMFGSDGLQYVRCPVDEMFDSRSPNTSYPQLNMVEVTI